VPDFDLWVRALDAFPDGTAYSLMSPGLDLVAQTNYPLGDKTIPPHAHGETCGAQLGGHCGIALPAGTLQNDDSVD
jgi:hypothetical protein